jgi:hypothetical protein
MDRTSDEYKTFVANAVAKPPERRSQAEQDAIRYEMLKDELARGSTTFERANEINRELDEVEDFASNRGRYELGAVGMYGVRGILLGNELIAEVPLPRTTSRDPTIEARRECRDARAQMIIDALNREGA